MIATDSDRRTGRRKEHGKGAGVRLFREIESEAERRAREYCSKIPALRAVADNDKSMA